MVTASPRWPSDGCVRPTLAYTAVQPVTVGLALIARNEEDSLPNLLKSIEGCFDQVVLCDTGSTDKTLDVFEAWGDAEGHRNPDFDYHWIVNTDCNDGRDKIQDFSVARNAAHAELTTDWEVWADTDDVIVGAQNIRAICEQAPPQLGAYICDYNYAHDPNTGTCVCVLKRERLVRRGITHWEGRVHEAQPIPMAVTRVMPENLVWVHQKGHEASMAQYQTERNLRILRQWVKEEPENTRVLAYVGTELAARGKHKQAIGYYRRYLKLNPDWHEEQAQVCRKMSASLFALERYEEARDVAFKAMLVEPNWPDSYITLAEYHIHSGELDKAMVWAKRAQDIGVPDTVLIINPLDYLYLPLKIQSLALIDMQQFDAAIEVGSEALRVYPGDGSLHQALAVARHHAKREHTANTFAMCGEQLIAHDEQLKALNLLENCVPHFAQDHPRIVSIRSFLRERLLWLDGGYVEHYTTGGSKPEDFVSDENIDAVGDAISRTGMLAYELTEQYEQQATEEG